LYVPKDKYGLVK